MLLHVWVSLVSGVWIGTGSEELDSTEELFIMADGIKVGGSSSLVLVLEIPILVSQVETFVLYKSIISRGCRRFQCRW